MSLRVPQLDLQTEEASKMFFYLYSPCRPVQGGGSDGTTVCVPVRDICASTYAMRTLAPANGTVFFYASRTPH